MQKSPSFIWGFLLSFIYVVASATTPITSTSIQEDVSKKKFATIKPFMAVINYDLNFSDESSDTEVIYNPNTRTLAGVSISFEDFMSFSMSTPLEQSPEDLRLKGETHYEDYRLSLPFNDIVFDFNYQQYQGFFVENSSSIDSGYKEDAPYLQDKNLRARNIAFMTTYAFDSDSFSILSALEQATRPTKSGGSWLVGFAYNESSFQSNKAFLPESVKSNYGENKDLKAGYYRGVFISGGYGQTWIFSQKYFISMTGQIGLGVQDRTIITEQSERSGIYDATKFAGFITTGWNGDNYLAGMKVKFDANAYQVGTLNVSTTSMYTDLFFGTRF